MSMMELVFAGRVLDVPVHDNLLLPKKKPCGGCPFRKVAPAGWLGGSSAEDYALVAHSDADIPCHTQKGYRGAGGAGGVPMTDLRSCAGLAIYRNNSFKSPRGGSAARACDKVSTDEETTDKVFKFAEFSDHHADGPLATKRGE